MNFVLYFSSMKTYFFFLVLIYSFRSEAQYFNSGLKVCDSIHNDSLDSLIEFAYKEEWQIFLSGPSKKETVTYEKTLSPDRKNSYMIILLKAIENLVMYSS